MIRKYRNRRLYDTEKGCYVNVPEVRERVLKGESIFPQASYQKTADEVTVDVLISIIVEDCACPGGPTPDDLRRFIESYSHSR